MIQTILVPTDGSSHANKAVSLAGELAQRFGARVVLLHALPDTINESIPDELTQLAAVEHVEVGDVLVAVGEEILNAAKTKLKELGLEKISTYSPRGPATQAILNYAKDHPVDLIVMGCRGLSNIEELFLGSVSHKVSHLATCSCLIVR